MTREQKAVLATTLTFVRSVRVYLQAVLPVVDGVDEQMVKGLIDLGGICTRRLAQHFEIGENTND